MYKPEWLSHVSKCENFFHQNGVMLVSDYLQKPKQVILLNILRYLASTCHNIFFNVFDSFFKWQYLHQLQPFYYFSNCVMFPIQILFIFSFSFGVSLNYWKHQMNKYYICFINGYHFSAELMEFFFGICIHVCNGNFNNA